MSREQTHKRRQAVETVHGVVSAMRAIAAGRIQSAQHALESARGYHQIVLRGLSWLVPEQVDSLNQPESRPNVLLVMTSEQPLCGSFNPNVLAFAEQCLKKIRETGEAYVLVVGQRGARQLIAHGITPEAIEPAATSLDGLHDLVKRLARLLGTRYATGKLGALSVIYIRFQSISEQIPTETRLLPPDFSALRGASPQTPPRFQSYLSREKLLAGLVDEYVFISLYLIAAESYASEQASRLVAMDASTRNTEKMLDSLIDLERRERQSEITREVLELIAARFVDRS